VDQSFDRRGKLAMLEDLTRDALAAFLNGDRAMMLSLLQAAAGHAAALVLELQESTD